MQKKLKLLSTLFISILLVSTVLILTNIDKVSATTVFSDGFENPPNTPPSTFTAWSSTTGSPSIVSNVTHSGTYAARFVPAGANAYKQTASTYSSAFMRAYVYFDVLPTVAYGLQLIKVYDSSFSKETDIAVYRSDASHSFWEIHSPGGYYIFTATINAGQWYCIELQRTTGNGNGINTLWVDGIQVGTITNDTQTVNAQNFYVGTLAAINSIAYIDDVVIADAYIGPMPMTASVTFTSNPTGVGYITVNGSAQTTPYTLATANIGDVYTIAANSPVRIGWGNQYVFSSWDDAGAQSHTYTVSVAATVTASFTQQLESLNIGSTSVPANQINSIGLGGSYVTPSQAQNVGGVP